MLKRNREVNNEVSKEEVIDAEFEMNETDVDSETENSAEEAKRPSKAKMFFKKWGPMFGIGAGVALAAFIGGRISGGNAACLDMLESEYGEEEMSDDMEDDGENSDEPEEIDEED